MKRYIITELETSTICQVYNYDMDTLKEMEAKGWVLEGTYYGFLTFRKDK